MQLWQVHMCLAWCCFRCPCPALPCPALPCPAPPSSKQSPAAALKTVLAQDIHTTFQHRCPWMQVDSKKELEKQVKASCEAFIMAVTKLTVEPMLSFITKVTAVKVATSVSNGKRLREQVALPAFLCHHSPMLRCCLCALDCQCHLTW